MRRHPRLGWKRWLFLIVAILLIALSWWRVLAASSGLTVRFLARDGVPMRFLAPAGAANIPGILVAHGFSGSQQVMLAYGTVLARAGYGVMLWDFDGHGANPAPLRRQGDALQENIAAAYAELLAQPEIDGGRVALLGHSMGSGAVMRAGIVDRDSYRATVAVSPTEAGITAESPRNLLLQAGAWEPPFINNAKQLLAAAGGENDDLAGGLARSLVIVPYAEHISILFNPVSHQAALEWLNRTFGLNSGTGIRDWRVVWYGLHLLGWLLLVTAASPLIPTTTEVTSETARRPWHWLGLLLAPFLASTVLVAVSRLVDISDLSGILVGGALALWFLVLGLIWLIGGFRPATVALQWRDLGWGLGLFALLWVAFGALAQFVWLPWFLIPVRLLRWPLLAAAFLPWLLAAGLAQQGATAGERAAWWLAQNVVLLPGLLLLALLSPSLGFLVLTLPLLPLVTGLMAMVGAAVGRPWAYGIGNALFFGWLILAVFPLAG